MYAYKDFVDEVRAAVASAEELRKKPSHEDPQFRKWRFDVTEHVRRVGELGYRVTCDIAVRHFGGFHSYGGTSQAQRAAAFHRDLTDTLTELNAIIANFDKYGEPELTGRKVTTTTTVPPPSAEPLKWPERVTFAWLAKHAPVSLWLKVGGVLVMTFVFGVAVGQSQLYSDVMQRFQAKAQRTAKPEAATTALGHR